MEQSIAVVKYENDNDMYEHNINEWQTQVNAQNKHKNNENNSKKTNNELDSENWQTTDDLVQFIHHHTITNDPEKPPCRKSLSRKTLYGSILFNAPFFKMIENFNPESGASARTAECYSCGKVLKGTENVTSNFIKHLKRTHPEMAKMYETYKIYRIKGKTPPPLPQIVEKNPLGDVEHTVDNDEIGDVNNATLIDYENNSCIEGSSFHESSDVEDDDKQSDTLSGPKVKKIKMDNSPHKSQQELSEKSLLAIGKLLDNKLKDFVTQSEFGEFCEKIGSKTNLATDDSITADSALNNLKQQVDCLRQECSSLRLLVQQTRASKRQLQTELERVDKMFYERKLIIRNIKVLDATNPAAAVQQMFLEKLGLHDIQINNCYLIPAKSNPSKTTNDNNYNSICIELKNSKDSKLVFSATHKLKSTGIFIESEMSPTQRKRKDKLMVIRKELLRRKPDLKVLVRNCMLIVNGKQFYWDDIEGLCHLIANNIEAIELNGIEYLKSLTDLDLTEFVNILQHYDIQVR